MTSFCRFWLAVQELKKRPIREVPSRVQEIWQEFLASGAPSAINVDSKSYAKTTQNVKDPGRYAFEDAQVSWLRDWIKECSGGFYPAILNCYYFRHTPIDLDRIIQNYKRLLKPTFV